jgi:hypothetical protein
LEKGWQIKEETNRKGGIMNPLKALLKQGQSIWLDYIRGDLIQSGELKRLVEEDGIQGVTSNPTIFEKAIAGSTYYDNSLRATLAKDPEIETPKLFERLAIEDIRAAADILRPVYDETGGATVLSASRCRRTLPLIPKARSPKVTVCGRRSIGPMS